jgi:hypothetical protein
MTETRPKSAQVVVHPPEPDLGARNLQRQY